MGCRISQSSRFKVLLDPAKMADLLLLGRPLLPASASMGGLPAARASSSFDHVAMLACRALRPSAIGLTTQQLVNQDRCIICKGTSPFFIALLHPFKQLTNTA